MLWLSVIHHSKNKELNQQRTLVASLKQLNLNLIDSYLIIQADQHFLEQQIDKKHRVVSQLLKSRCFLQQGINHTMKNSRENQSFGFYFNQNQNRPSQTLATILLIIVLLLFYLMFDVIPSRKQALALQKEGYTLEMVKVLQEQKENLTITKERIKQMEESLQKQRLQLKKDEEAVRAKEIQKGVIQHQQQVLKLKVKWLDNLEKHQHEKEMLIQTKQSYLKQQQMLKEQKRIVKVLQSQYLKGVTVIINSNTRFDQLNQTLRSFFALNSFPLKRVVVIQNGPFTEALGPLMTTYPNLTWLTTPQPKDQKEAKDLAFKYVETQWAFHTDDNWVFTQPDFLQQAISFLEDHSYKSHFSLTHNNHTSQSPEISYYSIPSLLRMKYYKLLPDGFASDLQAGKVINFQDSLLNFYEVMGLKPSSPEKAWVARIQSFSDSSTK